jgi:hypothetical protein
MNQQEYLYAMTRAHVPSVDQSLGILKTMNPVVDPIIPSDFFDPVTNMQPYSVSPALGSVQDAISVLTVTDLLFGR